MLNAIGTGCGLAVGTLIYSLLVSGVGPYRLDWPKAIFMGIIGFLAYYLYAALKSKAR